MQVGFGSEKSIISLLKSDEDSIVVTFDSCEDDSIVGRKVEIDKHFSGRHALVAGNTNKTILEFAQNNTNFKFDLIFIDKVDSEIEVISALVNASKMCHDKTIVCVDGSIDYIDTAWKKCVKQKYIFESYKYENLKCATFKIQADETQSQLLDKQKQLLSIKDKWQGFIDYSFLNFAADNLIKDNYLELENYDFNEIIKKYYMENSIITLIFKDQNQIKVLSKINIKDKKVIKSNSFKNIELNNSDDLKELIHSLKTIYEDFWKENNLINTSIKLSLIIQVNNKNLNLSSKFEEVLNNIDLISRYSISRFNKDYIFYEVIFNGTTNKFINIMKNKNYNFDTQKKVWILK